MPLILCDCPDNGELGQKVTKALGGWLALGLVPLAHGSTALEAALPARSSGTELLNT